MYIELNESLLQEATRWLCARDPVLHRVFRQHGYPPLWNRAPGFATLTHIILEQQVSLASANACFRRLQDHVGEVTPTAFLSLTDETLRALGYSRQKIQYTRNLAAHIHDGRLDLNLLNSMADHDVRQALTRLKGIGNWTADIYLSECLLRPDILPQGDIAMLEACKMLYLLPHRPDHPTFVRLTEHWRPWRSVGTRLLWHHYLNR
ncbi:MAG: hypothetical protein SFV52_10340 [Saprospiraceae bacterium]|nr:hypothetical protein [Saprospiraceae bacterium]